MFIAGPAWNELTFFFGDRWQQGYPLLLILATMVSQA
jgi:hypothetical protein